MIYYGPADARHPLAELLDRVAGIPIKWVIYYPLVPLGSRPCQWPGSIKVQVVSEDGIVYTAIRLADDSILYG